MQLPLSSSVSSGATTCPKPQEVRISTTCQALFVSPALTVKALVGRHWFFCPEEAILHSAGGAVAALSAARASSCRAATHLYSRHRYWVQRKAYRCLCAALSAALWRSRDATMHASAGGAEPRSAVGTAFASNQAICAHRRMHVPPDAFASARLGSPFGRRLICSPLPASPTIATADSPNPTAVHSRAWVVLNGWGDGSLLLSEHASDN